MSVFNLAMANIKRGKGAAFSLFILIFIAALLLNIGMTIILKVNTFYDDKVKELNGSHFSVMMNDRDYDPAQMEFLAQYKGVIHAESETVHLLESGKFLYGGSDLSLAVGIFNADEQSRRIAPLKLIEETERSSERDIYLPYSFKSNGGYKLEDTFAFTDQQQELRFRVAGFFETTMQGTTDMGMMKFFVPDDEYRQLSDQLGEASKAVFLSAIFDESRTSSQFMKDFEQKFPVNVGGDNNTFSWMNSIEMVKGIVSLKTNFIAMILVAFAAIIVIVSLIVIKFRVTNSIEDGMLNIGVLKAIGYTSKGIMFSIMMQFVIVTIVANVTAIAVYYVVMPVFGNIVSSLSGLIWKQSLEAGVNVFSMLFVIALVLMVTLFSSARIRKLLPIDALRGGIMGHSFKRNHVPLARTRMGLNVALACKAMAANLKHNVMIALIITVVTFASVFSVVLYYNVVTDKTAFVHMFGAETSNVIISANSGQESAELIPAIEGMDGVEKVIAMDFLTTKIDGLFISTTVSDAYDELENQTVFEGRNPQYDNEIAISWTVAEQMNKEIGDQVEVKAAGVSYSYLITGLNQSVSNMGQVAALTTPGARQLIPDYSGDEFHVYLKDMNNKDFIKQVQSQHGGKVKQVIDLDETTESQTSIYISAVFAVMVLVLSITVMVVILILYLVIKTMIIKRKRELGVLKAIGYTTFQLMTQIMYSFVPIVVIGTITGGVLGSLYTNSMLSLLLSSAGVYNARFTVEIPYVIVICIGLVVLASAVSMLVSRRIKHISAYELITE